MTSGNRGKPPDTRFVVLGKPGVGKSGELKLLFCIQVIFFFAKLTFFLHFLFKKNL